MPQPSRQKGSSGKRRNGHSNHGYSSDSNSSHPYDEYQRTVPTRAQLSGYTSYDYSQPTFAAYPSSSPYSSLYPALASLQDQEKLVHGQRSSDSVSQQRKQRYEVDSDTSERQPNRLQKHKCKIVLAIAFLILFVAVAIGVGVYLAVDQMSESRTGQKPTTTGPTVREPDFNVQIRIQNRQYTPQLADPTSTVYQTTKAEMEKFLDDSMRSGVFGDIYDRCDVTGFRRGSIIANYSVYFVPADSVQSNEDRTRLEDAKQNASILTEAISEGAQNLQRENRTTITVADVVSTPVTSEATTTSQAPSPTSQAPTTTAQAPTTTAQAPITTTAQAPITTTAQATTAASDDEADEEPMFTANLTLADSVWHKELADKNSTEFRDLASSVESEVDSFFTLSDMGPVYSHSVLASARRGSVIVEMNLYLKAMSSLNDPSARSMLTQMMSDTGAGTLYYFSQGLSRFQQNNVPALVFTDTVFKRAADIQQVQECPPDWQSIWSFAQEPCSASISSLDSANDTTEQCIHYANTLKCVEYVMRLHNYQCSARDLSDITVQNPALPFYGLAVHQNFARDCGSDNKLEFSMDLDNTPLCAVPDALDYVGEYWCSYDGEGDVEYDPNSQPHSLGTTHSSTSAYGYASTTTAEPIQRIPSNPCTAALTRASCIVSSLHSVGLTCSLENVRNMLSVSPYIQTSNSSLAVQARQCRDYLVGLVDSEPCLNFTDPAQQTCLVHVGPLYRQGPVSPSEVCSGVESFIRCLGNKNTCNKERTMTAVTNYYSVLYTFKHVMNVELDPRIRYDLLAGIFSCLSDFQDDQKCPSDWQSIWVFAHEPCSVSLIALNSTSSMQEQCIHYANTLKCVEYIMRLHNYQCSARDLSDMTVQNPALPFYGLAVHQNFARDCGSDNKLEFSMDLDNTPLCAVPDALVYVGEYWCSYDGEGDVEYDPNSQPPSLGTTHSSTSAYGSTSTTTAEPIQRIPSNPCTAALTRASCIVSSLHSVGLTCSLEDVRNMLSVSPYIQTSNSSLAVQAGQCRDYLVGLVDSEPCLNFTDPAQQTCLVHVGPLYRQGPVSPSEVCSGVESFIRCLGNKNTCNKERTMTAVTNYYSVLYTFKHVMNVELDPNIRYDLLAGIFSCLSDFQDVQKCPSDWQSMWVFAHEPCSVSLIALNSTSSMQEQCLHYANTLKCVEYVMRLHNYQCSARDLSDMTVQNPALPFYGLAVHQNFARDCGSDNKLEFSMDLDNTPLCAVPDALVYVGEYWCSYDGEEDVEYDPNSQPHSLGTTYSTTNTYGSASTTTVDPIQRIPTNPCTAALTRASCIMSSLHSVGLTCSLEDVGNMLSVAPYIQTSNTSLAVQARQCWDYVVGLGNSDPCLNFTDPAQQTCLVHVGVLYGKGPVSPTEVCSGVESFIRCLDCKNTCSKERTVTAVTNYYSVLYTFKHVMGVALDPNIRYDLLAGIFSCSLDFQDVQKCPSDWQSIWSFAQEPCSVSLIALNSTSSMQEQCIHYANTLKCVEYIMRLHNYKCSARDLSDMTVQNPALPFYGLAVHQNFARDCGSVHQLEPSMDLDCTPLCSVPDALVYVGEYWCSDHREDDVDYDPNSQPPTLGTTYSTTNTYGSASTTTVDPIQRIPSNPCTAALTRTTCIVSSLHRLGLTCSLEIVGNMLSHSPYIQTSNTSLAVQARQCQDYVAGLGNSDPCLNFTDPAQQTCLVHVGVLYGKGPVSPTEVCSGVESFIRCLDCKNTCNKERTVTAVTNYYSVLYTFKHVMNVELDPNIRYDLLAGIFSCSLGEPPQVCPNIWTDITSRTVGPCSASIAALQEATTATETCIHFMNSLKCMMFVLDAQRVECSVEQLLQMAMLNHGPPFDKLPFPVLSNFSLCSTAGVDPSFSVDLSCTPLCEVPDVLMYIGEYMCSEDETEDKPASILHTTTSQPGVAYTSRYPFLTTTTMDPMMDVPPNPCTFAFGRTKCIMSRLEELGLSCALDTVGLALGGSTLLRTSQSSFATGYQKCVDYLTMETSRQDRCFNMTYDPAQRHCSTHLQPFFTPGSESTENVCNTVTRVVECLVEVTGCEQNQTRHAIIQYLSVLYSYNYIIHRPVAANVNYNNIRMAFTCDDSKVPSHAELMFAANITTNMTWNADMRLPFSESFRDTASQIEMMIDNAFQKSDIGVIFAYSRVRLLWQGSVHAYAEIYLYTSDPQYQAWNGSLSSGSKGFIKDMFSQGLNRTRMPQISIDDIVFYAPYEYTMEVTNDRCFNTEVNTLCSSDLYILYSNFLPDDVCKWWYNRVMRCLTKYSGKECTMSAVDKTWRRYLALVLTLRGSSPQLDAYNFHLIELVLQCSEEYSKVSCPSYPDIIDKAAQKCYPMFASIISSNSTFANYLSSSISLSDTRHKPVTLQQRCQLYGDMLRCLALSLRDNFECDISDLHQTAKENPDIVFSVFGFYPYQCDSEVPDRLSLPDSICESTDLYELMLEYNCYSSFSTSASDISNSACLKFSGTVSCLSREASRVLEYQTCSEENVMSVLRGPMLSTVANYTHCFDVAALVTYHDYVLVRQGNQWVTVCGHNWDEEDAQVLCNQLGYTFGYAFNKTGRQDISGFGQVRPGAGNFKCFGNESSLEDCQHDSYPMCTVYDQFAAVTCSHAEMKYELIPPRTGLTYGYINLTRDEGTGLVCSASLQQNEAAGLCRAAGYINGGMVYPFSLDPPVMMDVWRNKLYCDNAYHDIESCVSYEWEFGPPEFTSNSDGMRMGFPCDGFHGNLVKVFCFDKPVKLHTGLFNSSGIAQVFKEGERSSLPEPHRLCQTGFDNFTADLFCKEIGFSQGGVTWNFNPYFYSSPRRYYHVSCLGTESSFTDCSVYMGSYYCPEAAAVRCHYDPQEGVSELDVRLLSHDRGSFSTQLVLIYYNGEWGSICADQWTDVEANAACKSVGYEVGFAARTDRGEYIPYLVHNVTCGASNTSLRQCLVKELQSSRCYYSKAAAVHCYNNDELANFHLSGGNSSNYGLVYVTLNNTKGVLCADMNDRHYNALCHSLGFISGERYHQELPVPDGSKVWGTTFMRSCSDTSDNLEACRDSDWYTYRPFVAENTTKDRPPECKFGFAKAFCYATTVKLNSGGGNRTGILQVYFGSKYQDICRTNLTDSALGAMCQNATGLTNARALYLSPKLFVGHSVSASVYLEPSCMESGRAAETCVERENRCRLDDLTAVHCYDGAISDAITGWDIDSNGRVVVERYGSLGFVCRDDFNDNIANLFCKSQGYRGGYRDRTYAYMDGRVPLWVQKVSCPTDAAHFSHCDVIQATSETQCFTRAAASVKCYSEEDYIKLYLVDSYSDGVIITGRVVAEKDNRIGYMCRSWKYDDMTAYAFCRMMNYSAGGFLATDQSMLPKLNMSKEAWSARLHCASGSPELDVMRCLTDWNHRKLSDIKERNNVMHLEPTDCSRNLATFSCYAADEKPGLCPPSDEFGITIHECQNDFDCDSSKKCCAVGGGAGQMCREPRSDTSEPTSTPSTTPTSQLWICPDFYIVWSFVSSPCMASLDAAKYSSHDKCSHYGSFLKCASFVMCLNRYHCTDHVIQQMALNHYWYFYTYGSHYGNSGYPSSSGSSSGYYGSSSHHHGSSGSSHGNYGSSSHYPSSSGSSHGYYSSSSDYHGSPGSSHGYYGSSSNYHGSPGSSHGYYGSSSDYHGSPGSSHGYYGSSSHYHGSSGSSHGYYGSSSHYPSSSGSFHGYYGSSSHYYGSSGSPHGYYGSSSDYHGSSGSSHGYYGSSSHYPSSSGSSHGYYGSSSHYPSSSGYPQGYYGSSSDYHGSSGSPHGYYGSSSDYHGSSGSSHGYYGSSSDYHGSSGSSHGYYGSSSDYPSSSGSSSGYYGSSSHHHGSAGSSQGYYGSSSDYHGSSGSPHGYYGSSSHYHGSSGSSHGYYGSSSHYHGSSGSSHGYYGSSSHYPSSSGSSQGYYGSSSDYHGSSGSSHGYYGSSSSGSSHGYYGSSSDYHGSTGSYPYSSDSYFHGSSSDYFGSSSDYQGSTSSYIYPSFSDSMYDGSSNYHGSTTNYIEGSSSYYHDSHYSGYGGSSYDTSLPVLCRYHSEPYLADVDKTEPCASPDVYKYFLQYHCDDTDHISTPPHHSSSSSYYRTESQHSSSESHQDSSASRYPSSSLGYFGSSSAYSGTGEWYSSSSTGYFGSSPAYSGSGEWYSSSSTGYFGSSSAYSGTGEWYSSSSTGYFGSSSAHSGTEWYPPSGSGYLRSSSGYSGTEWYPSSGSNYFESSSGYSSTEWYPSSGSNYLESSSAYNGTEWYPSSGSGYLGSSSGYNGTEWYPSSGSGYLRSSSGYSGTEWYPSSGSGYLGSSSAYNGTEWYPSSGSGYLGSSSGYSGTEWYPSSGSDYLGSSSSYYTPSPSSHTTLQSTVPDNACMRLSHKVRCIDKHIESLTGATCVASTMYSVIDRYSYAFLSTEVSMCNDLIQQLMSDNCFQILIKDKPSCLEYFHQISLSSNACSYFNLAVQCSIEKYPTVCTREHAPRILHQWLSAEQRMENISNSLGIHISDSSRNNLFQCRCK